MRVFEVTFPGATPRLASRDESLEVGSILDQMASQLASAAVSLHLFEQADAELTAALRTIMADRERRAAEEAAAIEEILAEEEATRGAPFAFPEREIVGYRLREEGALRAARKRWAAGIWPEAYRRQSAFAHAAAFVHVLRVFDLFLEQLVDRWGAGRPGLPLVKSTFDAAIRDLKDVRDSLAHIDERMRDQAVLRGKTYKIVGADRVIGGLGGKSYLMLAIDPKAVDPKTGTVPGRVGSISVTTSTVEAARVALQDAINEFQWDGDRRYEPR